MNACDFPHEKPLKLQTVIDALEMINIDSRVFYNTTTGDLYYDFDDSFSGSSDEAPDIGGDDWISLPDSYDIEDLRWMRDFAKQQPSPTGDTLLDAAYARHPYREFKDAAREKGALQSWFDFRDERLREVTLEWFARHNLTPDDAELSPGEPPTRAR